MALSSQEQIMWIADDELLLEQQTELLKTVADSQNQLAKAGVSQSLTYYYMALREGL